jgi:DUF1680 family protein
LIVSAGTRPSGKLAALPLRNISLDDGFWRARQQVNHSVSLHHGYRELERAGNFQNLRLAAGLGGGEFRGPVFMDEDLYKWLEAVAYEIGNTQDPELERMAEQTIELLAAAQQQDGYLNSYWQTAKAGERWTDLDHGHEMYCAGHLIQAAVAHRRATGKENLLEIACKLTDHIADTFGPNGKSGTDGHPEIEMALVELYRETGEPRYLALAKSLIDQRGQRKMVGLGWNGPEYHQDHVPVRQAREVAGHAVRQLYLNSGVTDLYLETGEPALLDAMNLLWNDMTAHKMHVTGGLGARYDGESFGDPYELPSGRAYLETCGAIANLMWNWRMLLATGEARFADVLERSLFNGFLSGISLEGDTFFYTNPLASHKGAQRQAWQRVACCPPNIMRQMATLGHYLATANSNGVQIHQYTAAAIRSEFGEQSHTRLTLKTDYPWEGRIELTIEETDAAPWELSLRIPGWCDDASVLVNGQSVSRAVLPGTYFSLERAWRAGDVVALDLPLEVQLIEANPRVDELRNCVAVQRGPLMYCFEAVDQESETNLQDVRINSDAPLEAFWKPDLMGGVMQVEAQGEQIELDGWANELYRPAANARVATHGVKLTAVPYFAWANRHPGAMRVWMPQL